VKPTENEEKTDSDPEGAGLWVNPAGVGVVLILYPQVETCGY